MVRAANSPPEYDSDDEFIAPRQQIRQPFINRQAAPVTGVPVAPTLDQRPSRSDPWSARMREKVTRLKHAEIKKCKKALARHRDSLMVFLFF